MTKVFAIFCSLICFSFAVHSQSFYLLPAVGQNDRAGDIQAMEYGYVVSGHTDDPNLFPDPRFAYVQFLVNGETQWLSYAAFDNPAGDHALFAHRSLDLTNNGDILFTGTCKLGNANETTFFKLISRDTGQAIWELTRTSSGQDGPGDIKKYQDDKFVVAGRQGCCSSFYYIGDLSDGSVLQTETFSFGSDSFSEFEITQGVHPIGEQGFVTGGAWSIPFSEEQAFISYFDEAGEQQWDSGHHSYTCEENYNTGWSADITETHDNTIAAVFTNYDCLGDGTKHNTIVKEFSVEGELLQEAFMRQYDFENIQTTADGYFVSYPRGAKQKKIACRDYHEPIFGFRQGVFSLTKYDLDGSIIWDRYYNFPEFESVDVYDLCVNEFNGGFAATGLAFDENNNSQRFIFELNELGLPEGITEGEYFWVYQDQIIDKSDEVALGINDVAIDIALSLAPNPATDKVLIQTDLIIHEVKVFDLLGNSVLQTQENSLDISNLYPGIYLVEIRLQTGERTIEKLIVN